MVRSEESEAIWRESKYPEGRLQEVVTALISGPEKSESGALASLAPKNACAKKLVPRSAAGLASLE